MEDVETGACGYVRAILREDSSLCYVPLRMRWPGGIGGGKVTKSIVYEKYEILKSKTTHSINAVGCLIVASAEINQQLCW